MKSIRFLRVTYPNGSNFTPYQPNDVAGFEDAVADRLVEQGSAVYASPSNKQSDGPGPKRARPVNKHNVRNAGGKFTRKAVA